MEKLIVGLGDRSYPIWIGAGILERLGEALRQVSFPGRVGVVSNPTVFALYGDQVLKALGDAGMTATVITIPDGESYKDFATLEMVYDALIESGFDRGCGLLALGGGVVGDLTGFAAATFLRGVPFVQVPTTLLSQVDSSVGGKTGINHRLGKNLIGAFYQPLHVHIDVETLRSLPPREFAAGMAEVVKYGVIRDRDFFDRLVEERESLLSQEPASLIEAVKRSCQIKADVVENDEKESSLRAILNFGHTFGHAVETLSGYGTVRHGEAVAIGMIAAALASESVGLCTREDVLALRDLLSSLQLPTFPPLFSLDEYLKAMGRDKKVKEGTLRMILNKGIGDCTITEIRDPEALFTTVLSEWDSLVV
jgi:3-dehydroquinate synthase